MATKGGDYTVHVTPNNHDTANLIFDADTQLAWLDALAYPAAAETGIIVTDQAGNPRSLTTQTGDVVVLGS